MQTFNSFNELAAGQSPLQSDMSVFNVSKEEYLELVKRADAAGVLDAQGLNDALSTANSWKGWNPELQQQIYDDLKNSTERQDGIEAQYYHLSGWWLAKGREKKWKHKTGKEIFDDAGW